MQEVELEWIMYVRYSAWVIQLGVPLLKIRNKRSVLSNE